jgi:hypothetical protein
VEACASSSTRCFPDKNVAKEAVGRIHRRGEGAVLKKCGQAIETGRHDDEGAKQYIGGIRGMMHCDRRILFQGMHDPRVAGPKA